LPEEKMLLQSNNDRLVLTTHRVRFQTNPGGDEKIVSIMLDELAICETMLRGKPWLMWAGAVAACIGIQGPAFWFGLLLEITALYLFGAYYATRVRIISLKSAAGAMIVPTEEMSLGAVAQFIDAVEAAKNGRYMARKELHLAR
jgi:hypothetical protein